MDNEKITSIKGVTKILDQMGLKPNKKFGQNFLIDENIIEKIAEKSNITKEDNILEIGPGLGALTERLLQSDAKKVVSVEIDHGFAEHLRNRFSHLEKFQLVEQDFLSLDIQSFLQEVFQGEPFKLVANLPYNITTPILMTFLEHDVPIKKAMVMLQKEVGERINAEPGTKKYGSLTVAIRYKAKASVMTLVPAGCFYPSPNVDSMVLELDFYETPAVSVKNRTIFTEVVRGAFNQRRKTLVNSLSGSPYLTGLSKEEFQMILTKAGLAPDIRGEKLSILQFAHLSDCIEEYLLQK